MQRIRWDSIKVNLLGMPDLQIKLNPGSNPLLDFFIEHAMTS